MGLKGYFSSLDFRNYKNGKHSIKDLITNKVEISNRVSGGIIKVVNAKKKLKKIPGMSEIVDLLPTEIIEKPAVLVNDITTDIMNIDKFLNKNVLNRTNRPRRNPNSNNNPVSKSIQQRRPIVPQQVYIHSPSQSQSTMSQIS